MSIYSGISDEDLLDEISQFRSARRELMLGQGVAVVAGEGRRMEFTRANAGDLTTELKNLIAEANCRGLIEASGGGAISLEF